MSKVDSLVAGTILWMETGKNINPELTIDEWREIQGALADKGRLDWLDKRLERVVAGRSRDNPYGEHIANAWHVEAPSDTVRQAIDLIKKASSDY